MNRVESDIIAATLTQFEDIYSQEKLLFDDDDRHSVIEAIPTILGKLPVFDFVQWTSSFTMEQIPNDQMLAWLKCCVDRMMKNCKPVRVLDIGCGTGLLFFEWVVRLAELHGLEAFADKFTYTGIELSTECTEMLRQRIEDFVPQVKSQTKLFSGAAHDVQFRNDAWWFLDPPPAARGATKHSAPSSCGDVPCNVDTVVINSVIMYFPSIEYLYKTFEECARHLLPGGAIYCGDVRDSRTLRSFYYSIAAYRDGFGIDLESAVVRESIDEAICNDPHLLVSPLDYIRFAAHRCPLNRRIFLLMEPKLSQVSYAAAFAPKGSTESAEDVQFLFDHLDNEMTRFRFDVTMYVDEGGQKVMDATNVCLVTLPVCSDSGALLGCALPAFDYSPYLRPPTSTRSAPVTPPLEQLSSLVDNLLAPLDATDMSSCALFTYPHVPVLVDTLCVQTLFDKEGTCAAVERQRAVRAAQTLLTPFELEKWFLNEALSSRWELTMTLHPHDPNLLVCIMFPAFAKLRVSYSLVAPPPAADASVVHLVSSQPKSTARQAHFYNIPDMVDRWVTDAIRRINSTDASFPMQPMPIGAVLWRSLGLMCSASGQSVAIDQPLGQGSVSWTQVVHWADALAEALAATVSPGDVVIQFVDRSHDQIVGMVSTFSIGAVFAPLAASPNPDPPSRIAKVITDCAPAVLLTQPHLVSHLQEALSLCESNISARVKILCACDYATPETSKGTLEDIIQRRQSYWREGGPAASVLVSDAAYCIYTSGSTSLPKAVVLTHANFHNLVCAFQYGQAGTTPSTSSNTTGEGRIPSITDSTMHTLQTTAASFDLHVYECLAPLYFPCLADAQCPRARCAPQLVLLPPGALDIEAYVSTIDQGQATHVVCTPTMLGSLAEYCSLADCWEKVRHVRVWRTGGEALKQSTVDNVLDKLRLHNPTVQLWCSYGPAECTDSATVCKTETSIVRGRDAPKWTPYVCIGRPLANYGTYVVVEASDDDDPSLFPRLARPGEPGMIYLAGPSVFPGYLQRVDLTNSVRIHLQVGNDSYVMYRTGDKGKYSFDETNAEHVVLGQFWHLGRTDFAQVKIRGQRIETTEIEGVLMQNEHVAHAIVTKFIVTTHHHDEEFLVAYFSTRPESTVAPAELSKTLRALAVRSFPFFMVPSSFTFVETFETNRNGKVDRKLLPPPQRQELPAQDEISSPNNSSVSQPNTNDSDLHLCSDKRLVWLRQQFLFHWLATVPCPSSELLLLQALPTFSEPAFTHSWLELGASSITLMRYIARIKILLHHWLSGGGSAASSPANHAMASTVSVPVPKAPQLTASIKEEIHNILTFPQVYKRRTINGVTEALFEVLFADASPVSPLMPRKKNPLASSSLTLDPSLSSEGGHQPPTGSLCTSISIVEPSSFAFQFRWKFIIMLVFVKRHVAFICGWCYAMLRFAVGMGPKQYRKLLDPDRLPGSTQQTLFYMDEQNRLRDNQVVPQGGDVEEGKKQYQFFNCPYVIRIKSSNGVPAITLRTAKRMIAQLEAMMKRILQDNPSARVTLVWDIDRIVQYVHDLDDPSHADDVRMRPHYVYAPSDEAEQPVDVRYHFAFSTRGGRTPLTDAVRNAAREKIAVADTQSLFRFHVFYELEDACKGLSVDDDASVLDAPLVSLHVMLNFHHAIFDGESIQQVMEQIVGAASAGTATPTTITSGNALELSRRINREDPFFKYCGEIATGRRILSHQADIYYWLRHMEGWRPATSNKFMPRTSTPEDGKWPSDKKFYSAIGKIRTFLTISQGSMVRQVCSINHWTPYSVFLSCYYLVLALTQRDKDIDSGTPHDDAAMDICIGSAFSNRVHAPALQHRVCCFSDMYPFRQSNLSLKQVTLRQLLDSVQDMLMSHMEHSTVDFGTILAMMGIERTPASVQLVRSPLVNPLFAPVLLYEDVKYCQVHQGVPLAGERVDLELLDLPDFGALAEIQLKIQELLPSSTIDGSPFSITWEYASELYDAHTMQRMALRYDAIIKHVLGGRFHETLDVICTEALQKM